jgi:hypothetical protein
MSDSKLTVIQKTPEEMMEYIDAQQKVLTQLNKKIQKVENENIQLKIQLEKKSPMVVEKKNNAFAVSDEESIAREQLYLLRQVSMERELSYEECKKVDTYTKILLSLKAKEIPYDQQKYDEMTPEELEKLVENGTNGQNK